MPVSFTRSQFERNLTKSQLNRILTHFALDYNHFKTKLTKFWSFLIDKETYRPERHAVT